MRPSRRVCCARRTGGNRPRSTDLSFPTLIRTSLCSAGAAGPADDGAESHRDAAPPLDGSRRRRRIRTPHQGGGAGRGGAKWNRAVASSCSTRPHSRPTGRCGARTNKSLYLQGLTHIPVLETRHDDVNLVATPLFHILAWVALLPVLISWRHQHLYPTTRSRGDSQGDNGSRRHDRPRHAADSARGRRTQQRQQIRPQRLPVRPAHSRLAGHDL